jgi:hypothetical protein
MRRDRPVALLWGDSFAAHLAPGIRANAAAIDDDILQYSVASCAPIFNRESTRRSGCGTAADVIVRVLKRYQIKRVILSMRWDLEARYYDDFFTDIRATIDALRGTGAEVVVIGASPVFTFWDSLDVAYRLKAEGRATDNYRPFLAFPPDWPETVKRNLPGSRVIDPMNALCSPDACDIFSAGQPLYIDGGHLSVVGSTRLIRSIAAELNGSRE